MNLFKESKPVSYTMRHRPLLTNFNDAHIAFVVGIKVKPYHAVCVTKAGRLLFSKQTPATLCSILERIWQIYRIPTYRQVIEAWAQTMAQDGPAVRPSLHQFPGPLRVASCGRRSFWSPNPNNEAGLWFFTPACSAIEIHGNAVTFQTQTGSRVIHWSAKLEAETPLPVSQARVDLLAEFVSRKALIIQTYAQALLGQLAQDQGLQLKHYPAAHPAPQFPLSRWFLQEAHQPDLQLLINMIFGRSADETGEFIETLANLQQENDEKNAKK